VRRLYGRLNNAHIDNILNLIKPQLENAGEFDYDMLSKLVGGLPKFSLALAVLPSMLRLP